MSSLPGLRLRNAVSRGSLTLVLVAVAFFAVVPLIIVLEDPNARLAFGRSKTTTGTIIQVGHGGGCRGGSAEITYAFLPQAAPEFRSHKSVCPSSAYFEVSPGDSLPVLYLESDPSINTIAGEPEATAAPYVGLLIAPVFALFVFTPFLMPQLRRLVRDRRLFRSGRIAEAKVVFVKQNGTSSWPGWPGFSPSEVFVSYELPSGVPCEARALCQNEWLLVRLEPGSGVHIAYSPKKPSRGVLLEGYIR